MSFKLSASLVARLRLLILIVQQYVCIVFQDLSHIVHRVGSHIRTAFEIDGQRQQEKEVRFFGLLGIWAALFHLVLQLVVRRENYQNFHTQSTTLYTSIVFYLRESWPMHEKPPAHNNYNISKSTSFLVLCSFQKTNHHFFFHSFYQSATCVFLILYNVNKLNFVLFTNSQVKFTAT